MYVRIRIRVVLIILFIYIYTPMMWGKICVSRHFLGILILCLALCGDNALKFKFEACF